MLKDKESRHLIIFAKPPILGKVKTRLAKDLGNQKTLQLYQLMFDKTIELASSLNIPTTVFFTEKNEFTKNFKTFEKTIQAPGDLGLKMKEAINTIIKKGFNKVVLIGADCPDNSSNNLLRAFNLLEESDVVFGPSVDGGYYLVGMKKMHDQLFNNKIWSTETVYQEALNDIASLKLKSTEVETINDIDTFEDLKKSKFYKFVRTID